MPVRPAQAGSRSFRRLRVRSVAPGPSAARNFLLTAQLMTRQYWLMKSEPDECSIDDALAMPAATVPWTGVRNYRARNYMRDSMRIGDGVLFHHSSCPQPGIAGIAEVAST